MRPARRAARAGARSAAARPRCSWPTAASAPSPACAGSMISLRTRGTAAARSARPAGEIDVRGRVDELAGHVGPAADERRALRPRAELVAGAADHEALDAARRLTAAPATGVVAADDGAFGQRADLLGGGRGAATDRAPTRPSRRRGTRAPPARQRFAARRRRARVPRRPAGRRRGYTIATGSASATARSGAPSSIARAAGRRREDRRRPRSGRQPSLRLPPIPVTLKEAP